MLKARIITALAMAGVVVAIIFWGPPILFQLLLACVFVVASWEWARLSGLLCVVQRCVYVLLMLCAGGVGLALSSMNLEALKPVFIMASLWWGLALLWVQSYPSSAVLWGSVWARCVIGVVVLLPGFFAVLLLRELAMGQWLILIIVTLVASADIGAYFFGRAFGKRKLAARVSPGKSWEGVAGGILTVLIMTLGFIFLTGRSDIIICLAIALPTAFVSVLGDLLESMLKRHQGLKDSGAILPGHGGVLDRIDGLTSSAPVFALALLSTGWTF